MKSEKDELKELDEAITPDDTEEPGEIKEETVEETEAAEEPKEDETAEEANETAEEANETAEEANETAEEVEEYEEDETTEEVEETEEVNETTEEVEEVEKNEEDETTEEVKETEEVNETTEEVEENKEDEAIEKVEEAGAVGLSEENQLAAALDAIAAIEVAKLASAIVEEAQMPDESEELEESAEEAELVEELGEAAEETELVEELGEAAEEAELVEELGEAAEETEVIEELAQAAEEAELVEELGEAAEEAELVEELAEAAEETELVEELAEVAEDTEVVEELELVEESEIAEKLAEAAEEAELVEESELAEKLAEAAEEAELVEELAEAAEEAEVVEELEIAEESELAEEAENTEEETFEEGEGEEEGSEEWDEDEEAELLEALDEDEEEETVGELGAAAGIIEELAGTVGKPEGLEEEEEEESDEEEDEEYDEDDDEYYYDLRRHKYRKKRSVGKKVLIVLAALLAVVLLVFAAGYGVFTHYYNKLNHEALKDDIVSEIDLDDDYDETAEDSSDTDIADLDRYLLSNLAEGSEELQFDDENVTNILLIGTDNRDGSSRRSRSDSMIILSINRNTKKIVMTSVMRDTYANISGVGNTRINAAYAYGGPKLLINTIENNFKIHLEKYAQVDFYSFMDIVDAVGGVTLNVSADEIKVMNSIYIPELNEHLGLPQNKDKLKTSDAGLLTMNGKQAVAYSRVRYVGNADFGRTERQRKILTEIFKTAKRMSVSELDNFANVALPSVTTNLTQGEVLSLLVNSPEYLTYDLVSARMPADGTYSYLTVNKMSVLGVDFAKNRKYWYQTVYGNS